MAMRCFTMACMPPYYYLFCNSSHRSYNNRRCAVRDHIHKHRLAPSTRIWNADASHIAWSRPVSGCEFEGLRPTRRPSKRTEREVKGGRTNQKNQAELDNNNAELVIRDQSFVEVMCRTINWSRLTKQSRAYAVSGAWNAFCVTHAVCSCIKVPSAVSGGRMHGRCGVSYTLPSR